MCFRKCPECGAYLDPDEICDCWDETGGEQEDDYFMGGKIK